DDPLINKMHIKMSGCPNGCSQHHIGNIGLYGASIKAGERTIPAYIAHLGGEYDSGEVAFGTRLKSRLPAKRVPDAIERILRHYQERREGGEEFNSFVARQETGHFEGLLADLAMPEEFSLQSMNHFIDWNRSEPYQVIRGEGECAV
nr:nitrite/sulfite reductase [Thermoleophilaceae bacterium]